MKNKILVIVAIWILIGVNYCTLVVATENKETLYNNEENKPWSLGSIGVTVQEIYGTKDTPQYRPLSGVKVSLLSLGGMLGAPYEIKKITEDHGWVMWIGLFPVYYVVTASKEGYVDISSGAKKCCTIAEVNVGDGTHVKFTVAEKGSPWELDNQQTAQTKEPNNLPIPITTPTTSSKETLSNKEESNLWSPYGHIVATVQEIYGTKDTPQYRPLSGVTVSARGIHKVITDENGKGYIFCLNPGLYTVKASKEGYTKKICMALVNIAGTAYVRFILAEKGSIWDQQTTQTIEPDELPTPITLITLPNADIENVAKPTITTFPSI